MMLKMLCLILFARAITAQTVHIAAAGIGPNHRDGNGSGQSDCRESLDASFYSGMAVDTFGAAEDLRYVNRSEASNKHLRAFAGFQFGYRVAGDRHSPRQLWLYGETVHGVRSAEADCQALTCGGPARAPLFIIRNASSLEGALGLRFEFLRLQAGGGPPAAVYAKAQAGLLKIAGTPGDAVDVHHIALGVHSTQGIFRGSYLEGGWGRNDLFPSRRRERWKMDARLVRRFGRTPMSFFARMTIDSDLSQGSDTIQSYIGIDFNLRRFSGSGR